MLSAVKTVCDRTQRPCLTWDVGDGFQPLSNWRSSLPSAADSSLKIFMAAVGQYPIQVQTKVALPSG